MNKITLTKRNITLIVIIVLTIIGVVLIYSMTQKSSTTNVPIKSDVAQRPEFRNLPEISPPNIQKPFTDTINTIPVNVALENFSAPESLPIYEINQSPLSEKEITPMASALGLSKPTISKDYTGDTVYSYNSYSAFGGSKSLDVSTNQRSINYISGVVPKGSFTKEPTKEQLSQMAKSFLSKNKFIENTDSLEITNIQYQAISEEGHIQGSNGPKVLANISLSPKLENIPLIGTGNQYGSVSFVINANLEILSVLVDSIPSIKKGANYPLKTTKDIELSIAEASIQDIGDGTVDITNVYADIVRGITIKTAQVAYLKEENINQKILQPIFILKGNASLQNGAMTTATLYIPAIAK